MSSPEVLFRRFGIAALIGLAIRFVAGFIAAPLIARILGLDAFGAWSLLVAVTGITSLTEFGVSTAITVALSRPLSTELKASTVSSGLLILLTFSLITNASAFGLLATRTIPFEGADILSSNKVALAVVLTAGVIRSLQMFLTACEVGIGQIPLSIRAETLSIVATNLIPLITVWQFPTLNALAVSGLVAAFLSIAIHILLIRTNSIVVTLGSPRVSVIFDLLRFGIAQWLSTVGGVLFGRVDRIIVFEVTGTRGLALYALALSITSRINELVAIPIQSVVALIASATAAERISLFWASVRRAFASSIAVTACIIAVAPLLTRVFLAQETSDVDEFLVLLSVAYGLVAAGNAGFYFLVGLSRPSVNGYVIIFAGTLCLLGIYFLGRFFGLDGVALGNALYSIQLILVYIAARHVGADLRTLRLELARLLLAISGLCALGLLASRTTATVQLLLAVPTIGLGVLAAWKINPTDTRELFVWIRSRINRPN